MKLAFNLHDVQEISGSFYTAFVSTFHYKESEESDFDFESDNSDSDLSDFDSKIFECGEITPEVETFVENSWEICKPLDEVYGTTTSTVIQETITTATEESQCVGLKVFTYLTPGEDRNLIATCTEISFWCCCETIKKVSPIIAEATTNLIY